MAKLRPVLLLAMVVTVAGCSSSPKMPNAAYYMGETHLRRGEIEQAIDAYKVFINDPGRNPDLYLPRAYYMLAFAYYRQGRYDEALKTLDELERRFPEMDSVQVWTLRGDTSRELGYRVQALQEYDEAWRFAGQMDRIRLETRISGVIKDMSVDELTQAEPLVSDPAIHRLLAKQLVASGGSLIAAEDRATTADADAALAAAPPGEAQPIRRSDERRELIEQEKEQRQARAQGSEEVAPSRARAKPLDVPPPPPPPALAPEPVMVEPRRGPGKVACLAPLSGPDSSIGRKVCDSVTAAFGDAIDRVVTEDAGETSSTARAAWSTVVDDPAVVAAIAWLPRESTQAVAPMAETAGVPTILVSGAAGSEGRYVREWGPGRSAEVSRLTEYMVGTVHVRRFGIFYPDTPMGNSYLDRFTIGVRSNEGEVVGKQFYRTGNLDERPLLETLKKWRKRDVNVDAVFVPDQLANVEGLVEAINRDYPDVIVLGLASWSTAPAPLRAFFASGTDTAAFDAASALYGAVVGGGANTRPNVEERLRHVDSTSAASTVPATVYRLQNGTAEAVGG